MSATELDRLLAEARRHLVERDRPKKALQALDQAPDALRSDPALLALRGHVLLALGRDGEARQALEAAASAEPPAIDALLELGWWDLDEGEPDGARDVAQRALSLLPPGTGDGKAREEAHGLLIDALLDLGDRAGAQAALDEHEREHGGDHPAVLLGKGRLAFLGGRFADALPSIQAARQKAPAALAWWWEGVTLERLGRLSEAEAAYRAAHKEDPATHLPTRIGDERFDRIVEETLAGLPEDVRAEVEATCVIVRQDYPDPTTLSEEDDPFLLGTCLGTSEGAHRREHAGYEPTDQGLVEIVLYRRNLERISRDKRELEREIRTTLLHEIGHALGLDEDGVAALGLR